ncbi:hypothetical protein [Rhodococcus sp. JS3073]|nr:hypothetical protein [Rhodococcus sp. JS3073]WAM19818.1 hypothetical protein OYT95_39940 [Rhodococcus sp. JS3073]
MTAQQTTNLPARAASEGARATTARRAISTYMVELIKIFFLVFTWDGQVEKAYTQDSPDQTIDKGSV